MQRHQPRRRLPGLPRSTPHQSRCLFCHLFRFQSIQVFICYFDDGSFVFLVFSFLVLDSQHFFIIFFLLVRHVQGVCDLLSKLVKEKHGLDVNPLTDVAICCGQSEAFAASILASSCSNFVFFLLIFFFSFSLLWSFFVAHI